MNKVIAFDLDATLINEKNEIIGGEKTLEYLRILHDLQFHLVINTGRLDHDIDYIVNKYHLPIDGRISQNGSVVYTENKLQASTLKKEEALRFYKSIKNKDIRIEMNTVSNRYWHDPRDPDFPKEFYDSSHIVEDFSQIIQYQPVVLFLLIGDDEVIDNIRSIVTKEFPHLSAFRTSSNSLEVLHKGVNKGTALTDLYGTMELYAVGDSENDFPMFDLARKSYIISPGIHETARTVKSVDDALEEILEIVTKDR